MATKITADRYREFLLEFGKQSEASTKKQSDQPAPPDRKAFDSWPPASLDPLRPNTVSMKNGAWDTSGILKSTPADIDQIFSLHAQAALDHLPLGVKLKFVFFAHGGLVSEDAALTEARSHIVWWNNFAQAGVYPVYFIWRTGFWESVGQLFENLIPHDTLKPLDFPTDPVLALIARAAGGVKLWSVMKQDAQNAMLATGVGTYVARQLKLFCDRNPGRVELHAIGHSAGAVFHAHFIPTASLLHNPYFTTTHFMAPAVTVDTFLDNMVFGGELKAEVGDLTMYTMREALEHKDNCFVYRQSLLYLIYHALEPADGTPILGLQECIEEDLTLQDIFGLAGQPPTPHQIIFSTTSETTGRSASEATSHGGFSKDSATLCSIVRRILGYTDATFVPPYTALELPKAVAKTNKNKKK